MKRWKILSLAAAAPLLAASFLIPGSAQAASWAWCGGRDGFHQFSSGLDLYNNEWNTAASPHADTICGDSGSDWQLVSDQRAGNKAVLSFASVQKNYPGGVAVSSLKELYSTFAARQNATAGTDAEAAYDLFTVNNAQEIMFWVNNHGQTPAGPYLGEVRFGGWTWKMYHTATTTTFVVLGNTLSAGVHLLDGLRTAEAHGFLPGNARLGQVNFGFEIASTGGRSETFRVTGFTLAQR